MPPDGISDRSGRLYERVSSPRTRPNLVAWGPADLGADWPLNIYGFEWLHSKEGPRNATQIEQNKFQNQAKTEGETTHAKAHEIQQKERLTSLSLSDASQFSIFQTSM